MADHLIYRILADAVMIIHLAFIVFVMLGGALAVFFPKVVWMHLPCVIWGIVVELGGIVCPLTPLENMFRSMTGSGRYSGDFVTHFIEPVIYPEGLTREIQVTLAALVFLVNACFYGWMAARRKVG